ncbi:MAG: Cof-type HAD-IIB family hydrolase [Eubacteriales bacterium]|nr:Cof-type HAD-IIB family hydrolase [Eubacteriales bacterium]
MNGLKNRDIGVIAFDLDGTLLRDDKSMSERTEKALAAAAVSGRIIVPVTGRPLSGVPEEILSIPGIRYVISSNGAVTTDVSEGKTLREALIDTADAIRIIGEAGRQGCVYTVFCSGYGYSDPGTLKKITDHYSSSPLLGYILKTRRTADDIAKVIEKSGGAENIWIMASDAYQRDELCRIISSSGLRTVRASDRELEAGDALADKGLALRDLCGMLGADCSAALSFGDSDNDRGLADVSGIFAAVANAAGDLAQRADLITNSNNDDGPAQVIEKLLKDPDGSLLGK